MAPKREKIKKIENRARRQVTFRKPRKGLFKKASKKQQEIAVNSSGLTHPAFESVAQQHFQAPMTSSSCRKYYHQFQGSGDHTRPGMIKKSDQKDTNDQEIGKKTMEEVEDLQEMNELEELIMITSRIEKLIEEFNEELMKSLFNLMRYEALLLILLVLHFLIFWKIIVDMATTCGFWC